MLEAAPGSPGAEEQSLIEQDTQNSTADRRAWLLWDGDCGVCCWWVQWARKRGAENHFRIVPYQDAPSPPMTPELLPRAARSVQVITSNGDNLEAGRACLYVLHALGRKTAARILRVPPLVWFLELGYRIVADNRPFVSRFMSRDPKTCSS